jgi:hypothetical protein
MGYCLNGVETSGLPIHLVKPLLDKYDIPYLIETGTANGDSVRAAAPMFEKIWTIELIHGRQKTEDSPKNVNFLIGDSVELLPKIITELLELKGEKIAQYILFYLDAHYCDDVPNESGIPECPLLEEILCITEYGQDAIIIIDDARLFFGHPPYPHDPTHWPSIRDIFELLIVNFPYHHITITDDYVLAIPLHLREAIDEEWRNRFAVRYPNDKDKLRGQVKDVYKAFMNDVFKPFMEYIK